MRVLTSRNKFNSMKTFPLGGIHPSDNKKWSNTKAIEVLALPDIVNVPLGQHIGAPAASLVKKGDKVVTGQRIAMATGFVSAKIHSPIGGTVRQRLFVSVNYPVPRSWSVLSRPE